MALISVLVCCGSWQINSWSQKREAQFFFNRLSFWGSAATIYVALPFNYVQLVSKCIHLFINYRICWTLILTSCRTYLISSNFHFKITVNAHLYLKLKVIQVNKPNLYVCIGYNNKISNTICRGTQYFMYTKPTSIPVKGNLLFCIFIIWISCMETKLSIPFEC